MKISAMWGDQSGWLRIGQVVFQLKRTRPLFSERERAYKARIPLGFGWRLLVWRGR
jgi:hypothetical protein